MRVAADRGEAGLRARAEDDLGVEDVAAEDAAGGIEEHEGGDAAPVEIHGLEGLERQR